MKRYLLLATAAAACLAWSSAALALPAGPEGNTGKPDQSQNQDQGKGHGKGQGQGAGAAGKAVVKGASGAPGGGAPGGGAAGGGAAGGGAVHGANVGVQNVVTTHQGSNGGNGQSGQQTRRRGPVLTTPTNIPAVVGHPSGPASVTLQGGNHVTTRRTTVVVGHPPVNLPALSGWSRNITGPARDQQDLQWRQSHGGWDNNSPWRTNQNWWRGNLAFRLFSGERLGFFFIPGLGYVSVPSEYRVHYWRAGDMLPAWFWRYQVRDYWNYGLPQPPDGCMWVWVDNDVALIDASDGYILDIVHNAW